MTPQLARLLAELSGSGADHDRQHRERSRRMLNITATPASFVVVQIPPPALPASWKSAPPTVIRPLWLAEAAGATGGHVTTVELSGDRPAWPAPICLGRAG